MSGSLEEREIKTAKLWIREIRSKFPNAKKVKTVFLDVMKNDENFFTNVNNLWLSCSKMPNFAFKDIKVFMAENDQLKEEKEKLSVEKEEAIKKMESLKDAKSKDLVEYEIKLRDPEAS